MQKLIEAQFFCYPKNKNLNILYTDKRCLETRLFKALSYQISPKEGFLLRFRKTIFGHYLSKLNKKDKIKIKVLENKNLKIGYKNNEKSIFFEFDKNERPIKVLKKNGDGLFTESDFLGYSLIENYTKNEYFKKRSFIILALEKRWQEILDNKILHGDFTHFNILLSKDKTIHYIDERKVNNSILFDHFYFYSYYIQCLEKCKTIPYKDILEIKLDLQNIIFNICKLDEDIETLKPIKADDAIGLIHFGIEERIKDFLNFLLGNEK